MLIDKKDAKKFLSSYQDFLIYVVKNTKKLQNKEYESHVEVLSEARTQAFKHPQIFEKYLNEENLSKTKTRVIKDVRDFNIIDQLAVLKYYKNYALLSFYDKAKEKSYFIKVQCLSSRLDEVTFSPPPYYFETAIYAFSKYIILDGIYRWYGIQIGPNMEKDFMEGYRKAKKSGEVIDSVEKFKDIF